MNNDGYISREEMFQMLKNSMVKVRSHAKILVLLCKLKFKGNLILRLRKVGARLGHGPGKVLGKVRARLGQGWCKVWTKSKVRARSGQARSGQGSGKVGARSGQKARFGQGRGKLAVIPMYFTLITIHSPKSISGLYH